MIEYGDKYTLGNQTGREFAVVLAITNQNIADELMKCFDDKSE